MNLHAIAAPLVGIVNPPVPGDWLKSTGYTTASDGKRAPAYAAAVPLSMQVQGLTGPELKLVDALNIQGVLRAVHLPGDVRGVDRKDGGGGDLVKFGADVPAGLANTTWLVTLVQETWDSSGWCRVIITKQNDRAA